MFRSKSNQIAILPVFREAPAFLDFREDLYFPKKILRLNITLEIIANKVTRKFFLEVILLERTQFRIRWWF